MALTVLGLFFQRWLVGLVALLLIVQLGACGGGSGGDDTGPTLPPPITNLPGAGELKDVSLLKTLSVSEIEAAMTSGEDEALVTRPRYAVKAYRMTYLTQDGAGSEVLASALMVVPQKAAGALSPVFSYQHPTLKRDADAPSHLNELNGPEIALASLGFIVLSADYVGYGVSRGVPHPYILATPSAAAVIDMLTAARYWRQTQQIADNGQLLMAGYSEGGFVTMAAARAIQTGQSVHRDHLVLIAPGAGPYNAVTTLDELLDQVRDEYPLIGWLLHPGLLQYLSDSDRDNIRDALLKSLLGSDVDVVFMPTLLDAYLADDRALLASVSHVDDWLPGIPVRMFHGRDDRTVSFFNSSNTLQKMWDKGAGSRVSVTQCTVVPADHIPCVPQYWQFLIDTLGPVTKDL